MRLLQTVLASLACVLVALNVAAGFNYPIEVTDGSGTTTTINNDEELREWIGLLEKCYNDEGGIKCTKCGITIFQSAGDLSQYNGDICKMLADHWASNIDSSTGTGIHTTPIQSGGGSTAGSGCGPCSPGSASGAGSLMSSSVGLVARPRDEAQGTSLAPGAAMGVIDTRLAFTGAGSGRYAILTDPADPSPRILEDGLGGDATSDGIFNDTQKIYKGLRLYDVNDTLTTDLSQAIRAELETKHSTTWGFELFDQASAEPNWHVDLERDNIIRLHGNHYVEVTGYKGVTGSAARTNAVWIQTNDVIGTDAVAGVDAGAICSWGQNVNGQRWTLRVNTASDTSSRLRLEVQGGFIIGSTNLVDGGWHHVAAVVPVGATNITDVLLYVDGQLETITSSKSQTLNTASGADVRWGRDEIAGRRFIGDLDDGRIYSRALSASEIADLASGTAVSGTGLEGQWLFDETSGTTAADASTNGRDGTTKAVDPEYVGRLTEVKDRNGYGIDLTYKTWTAPQINESPSRQWQVDTMTDAYGRETSFDYASAQVSGRWVIEQATLPNTQTVDFGYANGKINEVDLPDGTTSTYDWSYDSGLNMAVLEINDAAASGTDRNKTWLMSTSLGDYRGLADDRDRYYNQASMLVRAVINGAGELAYAQIPDRDSGSRVESFIYMGAGRARYTYAQKQVRHLDKGWTLGDPSLSDDAFSTQLEPQYRRTTDTGDKLRRGIPSNMTDERGNLFTYTYSAENLPTKKTYSDATFEEWDYNGFNQVTRHRDRLGRETTMTYDSNGNMLTRKVGILNGVDQAEVATYQWSYYDGTEGSAVAGITGAASPQPVDLKKSETDANGNVTHFVYNSNNFLIAAIQPADRVGDDRAITLYEYDSAGRLTKAIDPLGRETTYTYDLRDRVTVVTYEDGSTQRTFYANELVGGAGSLANLVVAVKDRNDNYTQYRYDGQGRRVTTIQGITTETDALNLSFIPDTTYHDVEECVYLDGTNRKIRCTRNGERIEYAYDFRHRSIESTVYPRDEGTFPYNTNLIDPDGTGPLAAGDDPGKLVNTTIYKDNLRFASVDPYGRATFYAYRASDSALIRSVRETVPGGSSIDLDTGTFSDVINLTRDLSFEDAATLGTTTSGGGAAYLITDMIKDTAGQTTSIIDPRNIQHDTDFDSRGRTIESVTAVGTTVEAKSETVYDAQSNVIESRSARYFDSADTEGFNKAHTTMTYTGRNLLATKTVAAGDTTYDTFVTSGGTTGLGAKATEEMFYYLDGRHEKTVDFNGKDSQFTAADHEWLTIWRACCERIRATIDPEGHGQAQGTDFNGNVAHTAVVDSLIDDVVVDGTTGARTIADSDFGGIPGYWDAPDARTLSETTTRFDSKNRPVASTVWLEKLDKVDPNDPPILYGSSIEGGTRAQSAATGLGSGDGLTTLYYYSEDIYETPVITAGVEGVPTRGPSQGNTILVHQFSGAPDIDLQPMLNELSADDILVLRDDYTNASAMATINAEGEISVTIMDGLGRAVISAMLDPTNNSVITWSTASHDRISDALATSYGDTLESLSISALNHLNRSFTDGAGRTIESEDAEGEVSFAVYDNNGNAIRTRNANAVGQDCDFDPRNRDISCTDTQGDTIARTYNDNNQVLTVTDAKGVANKADTVYDARGRTIKTTSRLALADTNKATYDPNSNLLTQTDAEGGTTTYEYDPRNLRIATLMPGHNPASVVGDADYDRAEMTYDAMRRPLLKTDQLGDTCVYTYDLASRLLTREYRTFANSTPLTDGLPTGTIADTDTFTYDDASRPLTAIKGRYSNTVAFAYDNIGRPTSEALTTNGQTYTTGYTNYDDDSRLTTLTYPDGSTVATTYTDRNQAEDIDYTPSGGSATTIATMSYDAGMRHTSSALGNGLTPTYTYRGTTTTAGDNMLESITVATRAGLTFDYTYDANKNMTAEDTGGVMDDFGVDLVQDAKDRMTSWTRDTTNTALDSQSWNLSFESDWDDSTLTDGGTGVTQTRTHNAPHELLTIDPDGVGGLPAFSQTHDPKGNLTADGDGLAHTFDFDNHLQQVVVSGASPRGDEGTHTYAYDALGRRVNKSVDTDSDNIPDVTTVFVCAGQQVIAEYTGGTASTDPERKYIFCATGYIDEPIALIDATGVSEDTYYYHRNRQFSIIGLTDDTGVVIERYAYTAYGEVTVLDANAATDADGISDVLNPYTYTGRRLDDETGLLYFRARYHDPVLGRFLERDPLGYPDGMNTYAAYHVMYGGLDPSGMVMGIDKTPVKVVETVLDGQKHFRSTLGTKLNPNVSPRGGAASYNWFEITFEVTENAPGEDYYVNDTILEFGDCRLIMNATLKTAAYVTGHDGVPRLKDLKREDVIAELRRLSDPGRFYHLSNKSHSLEGKIVHEERHQWQFFYAGQEAFEEVVQELANVHGPATSKRQLEIIAELRNDQEKNLGGPIYKKLFKRTYEHWKVKYPSTTVKLFNNLDEETVVTPGEIDAATAEQNFLIDHFGITDQELAQ